MNDGIGVVVIGRNEGERLRRCLQSVHASTHAVYVDSGSTDNSVELALDLSASVVALDMNLPFTAARARNAGVERLIELVPEIELIQFVDGDCEMRPDWLIAAAAFLRAHPDVAMVCGRLRERFPEASLYNRLCDIEWDTPVGEAKACGGIAMARAEALRQVGGFREGLIAGEEPELCVRLRATGWRIWRLDVEMAWHDAAMHRFGQWWRRMVRGGYAFAEGAYLHGRPPERHWLRESRGIWLWAALLPVLIVLLTWMVGWKGLLTLLVYPLQVIRLGLRGGRSSTVNWWRAGFLVLGKFPELQGQIGFLWRLLTGGQQRLIEYK